MPPGSTLKATEKVVDETAAIIKKDPSVDWVFERINVGEGHVNIVLKKNRTMKSSEFERNLAPTLAAIPDARVSFQSQGGGPDPDCATSCSIWRRRSGAAHRGRQQDRTGNGNGAGIAIRY